jgi:hypothetical protein
VAERLNALVLKTSVGESLPWVRIPPPPPQNSFNLLFYMYNMEIQSPKANKKTNIPNLLQAVFSAIGVVSAPPMFGIRNA